MSDLRTAAQQALEALLDDPNKMVQISEHHWESKRDLAVIAIRAALAEPDLSRCPKCGGPADNGHDREVPPNPYWCSKCSPPCAASGCNYPEGECLNVCRAGPRPVSGETVSLAVHDRICQDLYRQIRGLIVENERLRSEIGLKEAINYEYVDMLDAMEQSLKAVIAKGQP